MSEWKQRYPRLSAVVIDGVLYLAAYLVAFHLFIFIKGVVYPPVAWGSVNIASSILFPIAFLAVGYYRGGWRVMAAHMIILLGARLLLASRIAELEKIMGHERAFSAIWPRYLPWIAALGFALTALYHLTVRKGEV